VPSAPPAHGGAGPGPDRSPLTAREIFAGPPVAPLQRLTLYGDDELEETVQEWLQFSRPPRYARVQRAPGAGDMGRDVIGYDSEDVSTSPADVYQCKAYGQRLRPSDVWVEFGKVCVYTHRREYPLPRRFLFVSTHGVGPKLHRLLENPEELKRQLIEKWPSECAGKISDREVIPLKGDLRTYVESFEFSIFGYVEPLELIEGHRKTPYHARRFGGGLQRRRPAPPTPPEQPAEAEARYLAQLLEAYGDHLGRPCPAPSALDTEPPLRSHLVRQREAFYRAESLREFERDTLADDSAFEAVKDEIHRGVIDLCEAPHPSGYHRVLEVTREARRLQPTDYVLIAEMHGEDRVGICHQLANEDRLTWVP
jgi:hypothetical protein